MNSFFDNIGLIAGIGMPLFNIPLIWRIIQRRTSEDISLTWAIGVWACIMLMVPAGLKSNEISFKAYTISNAILFSFVVIVVLMYRKKR